MTTIYHRLSKCPKLTDGENAATEGREQENHETTLIKFRDLSLEQKQPGAFLPYDKRIVALRFPVPAQI